MMSPLLYVRRELISLMSHFKPKAALESLTVVIKKVRIMFLKLNLQEDQLYIVLNTVT